MYLLTIFWEGLRRKKLMNENRYTQTNEQMFANKIQTNEQVFAKNI